LEAFSSSAMAPAIPSEKISFDLSIVELAGFKTGLIG